MTHSQHNQTGSFVPQQPGSPKPVPPHQMQLQPVVMQMPRQQHPSQPAAQVQQNPAAQVQQYLGQTAQWTPEQLAQLAAQQAAAQRAAAHNAAMRGHQHPHAQQAHAQQQHHPHHPQHAQHPHHPQVVQQRAVQNPQILTPSGKPYTLPAIPGVPPQRYAPKGTGLVLEGGGTRGFYSAGVFEAFMDAGIMFPYISAVSAGAANVLSYISGQRGRNRLVIERFVSDPRYLSIRNLIKNHSLFNYDFMFNVIPSEHLYFDQQMFNRVQTRLRVGALDCWEGRTVWFEKHALRADYTPVIASCSIPLLSPMVRYDDRDLYDGGILDPVPIEQSIADKNKFHVVVLTQEPGYKKTASKLGIAFWAAYRKYPHLIWAMRERHNAYNRQVALAEQLQREGRALIIRPQGGIKVSRFENDPQKLLALHDAGHRDGAAAVGKLRHLLRF